MTLRERPGYIAAPARDLYVVTHSPSGTPRAAVVLAGAMSLERSNGYSAWTRWARALADAGYLVLRFDYAGTGESTGAFSEQGFDDWRGDLEEVLRAARGLIAGKPVLLHGVRMGALLGLAVCDDPRTAHLADALLVWEPPVSGRQMLTEMLRRKLAADYVEHPAQPKRTRDDYLRALDAGALVEVDGYPWSARLWRSAEAYAWAPPRRTFPWHRVSFEALPTAGQAATSEDAEQHSRASLAKPWFWQQGALLLPELETLFAASLARMEALAARASTATASTATASTATASTATSATSSVTTPASHALAVDASDAVTTVAERVTPGVRREVALLAVEQTALFTTAHRPAHSVSNTHVQTRDATCVVLINFGYVPRDGHGGLAAAAADALAARGLMTFRLDLPALGDTPGVLPARMRDFAASVADGALVPVVRGALAALREREGISHVILGGLCAAAITSMYVADAEPDLVTGLIALEPELFVGEGPKAVQAAQPGAGRQRSPRFPKLQKLHRQLTNYWWWMRLLTHENHWGRHLPIPRRAILGYLQRRNTLPELTNDRLVTAWVGIVARGLPCLVATAEGKLREVFFDRVNRVALRGLDAGRVRHMRLPDTNHVFTTGGAQAAAIDAIVAWTQELGVHTP